MTILVVVPLPQSLCYISALNDAGFSPIPLKKSFAGSSSRRQLIKTVETNLIGSHVKSLLEKGLESVTVLKKTRNCYITSLHTTMNYQAFSNLFHLPPVIAPLPKAAINVAFNRRDVFSITFLY
jgi:hypothetical protein